MSTVEKRSGDPFPPNFAIVYDANGLHRLASGAIDTQADKKSNYSVFHLSRTRLGTPFFRDEKTDLFIGNSSSIIKSTISIEGTTNSNFPCGYFSSDEIEKLQNNLIGRDVGSQVQCVRGKNMVYIPLKTSASAYIQVDMGYPGVNEMMSFFTKAEDDLSIKLTGEEKRRRKMAFSGDLENRSITLTLQAENEWIADPHHGPKMFIFYFSLYEKFLRAFYQTTGHFLPPKPIHIKPD